MSDALQLQRRLRMALQNEDYEAAFACLTEAVEQARQAGDRAAEGRHLGNLALMYNRLGQPEEALRCFEQALALVRAEGDRVTEDGLLGNMGNVLRETERYEEAREYLHAALQIAQEIGDVRGRGIWLSNLGLVYDNMQQPERAIEYHSQSIGVARQLYDQRGLATRLRKLSDSFVAAGNPIEALKCLGEALTIYTSLGDQRELLGGLMAGAQIHHTLAREAQSEGQAQLFDQNALEYYRHALVLARSLTDRVAEVELLARVGETLIFLGDEAAARRWLQGAQRLAERLGMSEWLAAVTQLLEQLAAQHPRQD